MSKSNPHRAIAEAMATHVRFHRERGPMEAAMMLHQSGLDTDTLHALADEVHDQGHPDVAQVARTVAEAKRPQPPPIPAPKPEMFDPDQPHVLAKRRMDAWERQHQLAFQQQVHQHEWVMHHRDHFGNISDVIDKVALGTLHLYFESGAEGVRQMVNTFLSKNVDDTILRQAAARLLNRDEPEAAHVLLSSLRDLQ